MITVRRGSTRPAPSVESAIVIGYSVGLKYILGAGSQAMSNIAGKFVGKELCIYYKSKRPIESIEDVEEVLSTFAEIKIREEKDKVIAEISNCNICPKRVASYDFEGTACPWGGILAGFLEEAFGKKVKMVIDLKPGETCIIKLS